MPDPSPKSSILLYSFPQNGANAARCRHASGHQPAWRHLGGWLLCQMDLAGTIVATRRALGRVVTVAITAMNFHRPVMVGDEVTCFCNVEKIGNT